MNPPSPLDVIRNMNNAGGPAFPSPDIMSPTAWTGMSLRDFYAGCALIGLATRDQRGVVTTAFDLAQAMVNEGVKRDYQKQ